MGDSAREKMEHMDALLHKDGRQPTTNNQQPDKADIFQCGLCERAFPKKWNLQMHIKTHDKPFKCELCPKEFARKKTLADHMLRTHTVEKPFECGLCGKRFAAETLLRNHV